TPDIFLLNNVHYALRAAEARRPLQFSLLPFGSGERPVRVPPTDRRAETMKPVGIFTIKFGTRITFSTTPPSEDVITYGAKLFKRVGDTFTKVDEWTSQQLESGAAFFTFDAKAGESYQIDLGADVTKLTTIDTELLFDTPPAQPKRIDLDP